MQWLCLETGVLVSIFTAKSKRFMIQLMTVLLTRNFKTSIETTKIKVPQHFCTP